MAADIEHEERAAAVARLRDAGIQITEEAISAEMDEPGSVVLKASPPPVVDSFLTLPDTGGGRDAERDPGGYAGDLAAAYPSAFKRALRARGGGSSDGF